MGDCARADATRACVRVQLQASRGHVPHTGTVSESTLDDKLMRILTAMFASGQVCVRAAAVAWGRRASLRRTAGGRCVVVV